MFVWDEVCIINHAQGLHGFFLPKNGLVNSAIKKSNPIQSDTTINTLILQHSTITKQNINCNGDVGISDLGIEN